MISDQLADGQRWMGCPSFTDAVLLNFWEYDINWDRIHLPNYNVNFISSSQGRKSIIKFCTRY